MPLPIANSLSGRVRHRLKSMGVQAADRGPVAGPNSTTSAIVNAQRLWMIRHVTTDA